MNIKLIILLICISLLATPALADQTNSELNWKGVTWDLRSSDGSPGPNQYSPDGIYVDSQNRLHLTISETDGMWECSEIDSRNKYGYGTFTWTVASPVFSYDKNSVVGLFTYLNDAEELDIEISKWGISSGNNLWYSIQPYNFAGHSLGSSQYETGPTVHTIYWTPGKVFFKTTTIDGTVLSEFTCIDGVPSNPQYVVMNLWLTEGMAPSNGNNIELVISDFSYEQYAPATKVKECSTPKNIIKVKHSIKNSERKIKIHGCRK